MKKSFWFASIFFGLLICTGTASSETIDLMTSADWSNLTRNKISLIGFNNDVAKDEWAGSFTVTKTGGGFSTSVFCVEIDQDIYVPAGPYTFNVNDLAGVAPRYQNAGWLMNEFGSLIGTKQSGALQLAIWEVLYDNTFDLYNGNFQVMKPADGYGTLLSDISMKFNATTSHPFDMSRFATFTSPTVQDLIGIDPSPVPEPATMLLIGAGLAGLAGLSLRKK